MQVLFNNTAWHTMHPLLASTVRQLDPCGVAYITHCFNHYTRCSDVRRLFQHLSVLPRARQFSLLEQIVFVLQHGLLYPAGILPRSGVLAAGPAYFRDCCFWG